MLLLLFFYLVLLLKPITLTTSDLGRHLTNGKILSNNLEILSTNFYSYTNPSYPFVNHHWLSGILFYNIEQLFGFTGLSIFFGVISLLTLYLFFDSAKRISNIWVVITLLIFSLPVIVSRTEIRPEIFSYLLAAIFFWLLTMVQKNRFNYWFLYLLPVLELIWVNTHILFPLGILLVFVFLITKIIEIRSFQKIDTQSKHLFIVFVTCLFITLCNPHGLEGALYPLHIFNNYGYELAENQSLFKVDSIGEFTPSFFFKVLLTFLITSYIFAFFKTPKNKLLSLVPFLILGVIVSILGISAIRNFSLFGYFAFVLTAINLKNLETIKLFRSKLVGVFIGTTLVLYLLHFITSSDFRLGIGIDNTDYKAATFFLENNIPGPIFNNYDIGGYLIYYLYPTEKVFVDNRPEAYPQSFFKKVYIPMQTGSKWNEYERLYKFNAIFFSQTDLSAWGRHFIMLRKHDAKWALVYEDQNALIFVKRNKQNESIIQKFDQKI